MAVPMLMLWPASRHREIGVNRGSSTRGNSQAANQCEDSDMSHEPDRGLIHKHECITL
jgi:hypothetical protein